MSLSFSQKKMLIAAALLVVIGTGMAFAQDWEERKEMAYRNYVNMALGSYAWDNSGREAGFFWPFGLGLGFHFSPAPFINTGFEIKCGFFTSFFLAFNSSIGFVFPLSYTYDGDFIMSFFADGVLQIGKYFKDLSGIISENLAPGFDAGLVFWWDTFEEGAGTGFEIKYQVSIYERNYYTYELSISWLCFGGRALKTW
jgi:hypothetical protein